MDGFQDLTAEIGFSLRQSLLGRLKLRSGLPEVDSRTIAARKEQIFYRKVLERALGTFPIPMGGKTVWDVGCRNWSYARALAEVFPDARLRGVEVDGGRRYWNLYRRQDMAQAYAQELRAEGREVECEFRDFRDISPAAFERGDLFCFFYPFVSKNPCVKWGLPSSFSNFKELLRHIQRSEAKGSFQLLSCHQGEWEAEIALECYSNLNIPVKLSVLEPEDFKGLWPSPHPALIFRGTL